MTGTFSPPLPMVKIDFDTSVVVNRRLDFLMKDRQDEAISRFTAIGRRLFLDIKTATPIWVNMGDSWEKVRSKRGNKSGDTKRAWKIKKTVQDDFYQAMIENNKVYIKVLEFGGYGARDSKIWGNYAGKTTPRTRPSTGTKTPMKNNVSKQAPKGMVRISLIRAESMIKKKFGRKNVFRLGE